MLSNFRGEYLVLDVEGLNVDDDCYTWYMSVKDKVADWYNIYLCRGGFFICFIGVYLLIGLFII